MYGSSLMLVTRILRDSRIAAREAAAMPFPREETTPPVTKTYLVMTDPVLEIPILLHCHGIYHQGLSTWSRKKLSPMGDLPQSACPWTPASAPVTGSR